MKIIVTKSVGEGETKTSAFDKALLDAGIANYNLIRMSSVIPRGADIVVKKFESGQDEYGYRLYVVLSERYETLKGKKAVASIGWANSHKGGIFVEKTGGNREEVTGYIRKTIKSMTSYRPEEHGDVRIEVVEKECEGKIACALVAAVYKSEEW